MRAARPPTLPSLLLALLLVPVCAEGGASQASRSTLSADPPPPPPHNSTATAASSSRIDPSWSAVKRADGGLDHHDLYRDDRRIAQPTATSHSDAGLREDTEYDYEVTAVDGKGRQEAGARTDAETADDDDEEEDDDDDDGGGDSTAPTTPTGLSVSVVGSGRVDLSWNAASDPESGIAHYRVYRDGVVLATPGSTSHSDLTVNPGATYTYAVSAVNGDGVEGGRSPSVTVTTPIGGDPSPPGKPTGLAASVASATRIDLSWTAASDPGSGIKEYVVYRDGQRIGTPTGTSFTDGSVQPSTTYEYEVSAVNGAGLEGPKSDPVTATTPTDSDTSPPRAPSDLTATAESSSRIRLTWTAAGDPQSGISGYHVYRDGRQVVFLSATSYVDTDLEPDTPYRYRVSAVNGDGVEGNRSRVVEARTPPLVDTVPPAPPTGLRIVP